MLRLCFAICLLAVAVSTRVLTAGEPRQQLEYAPAPADNPLKGLVPYAGDWQGRFPHSLEFGYLPLSSLVIGREEYDWGLLEKLLEACASRGHQAVFRIYLEYPGKTDGIPTFLVDDGLKVHIYRADGTAHATPDYADARLRKTLAEFIAALGKRYDGDPRIGFITAGLLGYWGEWHTFPKEELFADQVVQNEVLDAYEQAFKVTPILLRYPVGRGHPNKAATVERRFGYHDDSFAWATLDTGRKEDAWFFMALLKSAGPQAMAAWKTHPIGGEIRPEAWGLVFDERPSDKKIQDFRRCVEETHASWVMDSGMFKEGQSASRRSRAEEQVRRMGYEFHIPAVTIGKVADGKLAVELELENRGVAPFYYDWPAEFGLISGEKLAHRWPAKGKLTGLLPEDQPRIWQESLDVREVAAGEYRLAMRVPNSLPKGPPLRFANKSQDADLPGWLTLGTVQIP